jgi:hypothetical protein
MASLSLRKSSGWTGLPWVDGFLSGIADYLAIRRALKQGFHYHPSPSSM